MAQLIDRKTYAVYAVFAMETGLPVPPVPDCDGKPCFDPGNVREEILLDIPEEPKP